MSWQRTLIQRLINQRYTYDDTNGFVLEHDRTPFYDYRDHEKWYYGTDTYSANGLKKFTYNNRGAIEDDVVNGPHTHPKADVDDNGERRAIAETVHHPGTVELYAASPKEDVFNAIRAKIRFVYEEGREPGAGVTLVGLADMFEIIISEVKKQYPVQPTGWDQKKRRAQFKILLDSCGVFQNNSAVALALKLTGKELEDLWKQYADGGGGNSHNTY